MNILAPLGLFIHTLGMYAIYHDWDEEKANSFGWTVFFDALTFFIFVYFMSIFVIKLYWNIAITYFDLQFLIIELAYCLTLGITLVLNYWGFIEHTYYLQITTGTLALVTGMVLISGIRHGYIKQL